jgi:hypothetical protein
MKKFIYLFLFLTLPFIANSQANSFANDYSKGDLTIIGQYVVIDVENLTVDETYKKVINWIKRTYSEPNKNIKATIDNEYIKITANGIVASWKEEKEIASKVFKDKTSKSIKIKTVDANYTLTFEFKPNKVKVQIINMIRTTESGTILDFSKWVGSRAPNDLYREACKIIPETMNILVKNLETFLNSKQTTEW